MVIKGNATGSITVRSFEGPCTVTSYSILNKTGTTRQVHLIVADSNGQVYVNQQYIQAFGLGTGVYLNDTPFQVPPGADLILLTDGSVDYFFNID